MLHQLTLIILFTLKLSSATDILMLCPFGGPSHKIIFTSLAKALGQNGHNVTLVSVFKPSETYPNVTEIVVPAVTSLHKQLQETHIRAGKEGNSYSVMKALGEVSSKLCDGFYETNLLKNWIQTRKFDSVIVDGVMSECLLPVVPLLTSSVIVMNTAALFPWISYPMSVPTPYSYLPILFYSLPPKMTFWQRLQNTISHEGFRLLNYWLVYPLLEAATRKHFPETKSILQAIADVNLVLVNADFVVSITRPEMPFVKHVAGLHLSPTKPLPENLAKYVESAGDSGVILFSLGSIFDGILTEDRVSLFLTAFSKLKHKFIWKYKEKLENVPENVKVLTWVPQQDLLAHPNVRVFITHAGLLSLQEAFYHQVPTVTLPVFADQPHNSAYLAYNNASVPLYWDTLSVDNIIKAVTRAAEDKTLRDNIKKMSKMFRNVPIPSMKNAVYWVEYVMRYQGANHLQSSAKNLNFFQYFLLDVLLLLLVIVFTVTYVIYLAIHFVINLGRKVKKD